MVVLKTEELSALALAIVSLPAASCSCRLCACFFVSSVMTLRPGEPYSCCARCASLSVSIRFSLSPLNVGVEPLICTARLQYDLLSYPLCLYRYLCSMLHQRIKKEGMECLQQSSPMKSRHDGCALASPNKDKDEMKTKTKVKVKVSRANGSPASAPPEEDVDHSKAQPNRQDVSAIVQRLIAFNTKCEQIVAVACYKDAAFTKVGWVVLDAHTRRAVVPCRAAPCRAVPCRAMPCRVPTMGVQVFTCTCAASNLARTRAPL